MQNLHLIYRVVFILNGMYTVSAGTPHLPLIYNIVFFCYCLLRSEGRFCRRNPIDVECDAYDILMIVNILNGSIM
jgi:hypothetical protein